MKRDALKVEIGTIIDEVVPENKELDENDIADIEGSLQDLSEVAGIGEAEEEE